MLDSGSKISEVKIPAKVMLAGEYAVLHGGTSLAATLSAHMTVRARQSSPDSGVWLQSALWPERISIASSDSRFAPMVAAATRATEIFALRDVSFEIDSGIEPSFGIGSSSALRLGILFAASGLSSQPALSEPDRWDIARCAWQLQAEGQGGVASGYDIVTQVSGGMVAMRQQLDNDHCWPGMVVRMREAATIEWLNRYVHVYVGGVGAPTAELTKRVEEWFGKEGCLREYLDVSEIVVAGLAERASTATSPIQSGFMADIANLRSFIQKSPAAFAQHTQLAAARGFERSWTYKTTGAGGDDALLVFADGTDADVNAAMTNIGRRKANIKFCTQRAEFVS